MTCVSEVKGGGVGKRLITNRIAALLVRGDTGMRQNGKQWILFEFQYFKAHCVALFNVTNYYDSSVSSPLGAF